MILKAAENIDQQDGWVETVSSHCLTKKKNNNNNKFIQSGN